MIGCRHGAKNTLRKNYLWFAERAGVTIMPERTVTDIKPVNDTTGRAGYAITSVRSGAWVKRDPRSSARAGLSSPPARWAPTGSCSGAS